MSVLIFAMEMAPVISATVIAVKTDLSNIAVPTAEQVEDACAMIAHTVERDWSSKNDFWDDDERRVWRAQVLSMMVLMLNRERLGLPAFTILEEEPDSDMTPLMELGASIAADGGSVGTVNREPQPFWKNPISDVNEGK